MSLYTAEAQHTVARQWNEVLLESIRNDFARPPVHARNLFHISMAMYDAWAVYDDEAQTVFLNNNLGSYFCPFEGVPVPADIREAREEAMSYAAYRIIQHRFANSPGADTIAYYADSLFAHLGYDKLFMSTFYQGGVPAALGNYIAERVIELGFLDGSNEINDHTNDYYMPINDPIFPDSAGNPDMIDPNRWQPITFDVWVDQSGNEIPGHTPEFQSPEWGVVTPFALTDAELTKNYIGEGKFWVYHDPGAPPHLDTANGGALSDEYKWNHSMVAIWASHLDPGDSVMIDISPATFGNNQIEDFPTTIEGLRDFYNVFEGGDYGPGRDLNPKTGLPYEPQIVPRADYTRVLAEFWADGPDSETPPGHWFTILNYVNDHPQLERRYKGQGAIVDALEWDVKAYLALAGAVHDAAVSAWGIKGWYDYVRPISAIRYMADRGQCTDTTADNFHIAGIPLVPGYIETVEEGDPLAGDSSEHVGKIKLYSWRGPDYIDDPDTTFAGVGWILAEHWWPYQRPTFITPPFAGYISGHSTFSRAAAEVLTMFTGDEYFPGGMGEFVAKKNEFLVFEEGPSVDLVLQWATYRDASDQTSLSRIWGGIHPPVDDIPGRLIGAVVGAEAFDYADCFFSAPDMTLDTVQLACAESTFEWPLDGENVNNWTWTTSENQNITGAENGESDTLAMLSTMLINTSDTAEWITYSFAGAYNNCKAVRQDVVIQIGTLEPTVASFDVEILDSAITCINQSTMATSYLWSFGDGETDTTANPSHVYLTGGEYEITLIATNACGSDTVNMFVQISTSAIEEVTQSVYFSASPNPNNGVFTIDPGDLRGTFDLQMVDITGQVVAERQLVIDGPVTVSLDQVPAGIYQAVISNDAVRDLVRVVIQ